MSAREDEGVRIEFGSEEPAAGDDEEEHATTTAAAAAAAVDDDIFLTDADTSATTDVSGTVEEEEAIQTPLSNCAIASIFAAVFVAAGVGVAVGVVLAGSSDSKGDDYVA